PTARTTGLLGSKNTFLGDDGQVGIISAVGNLLTRLLATASWWCSRGCAGGGSLRGGGGILGDRVGGRRTRQVIGRVPRLTLGAEQTLLEEAVLGFEQGDAGLVSDLTLLGGVKQGAVIASLLASLDELGTVRTSRAAKNRKRTREVGDVGGRRFRGS